MSDKFKYGLVVLYTVVSGGVLAFYAIAWMTNPASVVPHGVNVAYLVPKLGAGRNLALDFTALLLVILRKREALGYILLTLGLMELYDGVIGLYIHKPAMAVAPFINSFFYFVCTWYLLSRAASPKTKQPS
jgi:hypothetical protein